MRLYSFLRLVSLALVLSLPWLASAQSAPTWEWVTPARTGQDLILHKIALDKTGNSYVAGELAGQATLGTTVLDSRGWYDMVVAKYNDQGQCMWAHQAGPVAANAAQFGPRTLVQGIAVDASGQVYVLGTINERTKFDAIEAGTTSRDATTFLAKYSTDGNILWARNYAFGWPGDVAVGSDGSVYITHNTPASANGHIDGLLLSKLDAQGNILWSRGAWYPPTSLYVSTYARIATGPDNQVYLACSYQGNPSLDVSPGQARTPLPAVASGAFLARYSASGTLEWVRTGYAQAAGTTGTGPAGMRVKSLAADGSGNIIIGGTGYASKLVFGGLSLLPRGGDSDVYLVKYNAQGQVVWGHQEGSLGIDGGGIVATDATNNVYLLASFFKGRADYSGITITGDSQYQNNALVKYNSRGKAIWGITQDGGELEMQDLAVGSADDARVAGNFYNAFRLGSYAIPYSATPGAFKRESVVAKLKIPVVPDENTPDNAGIIPNIITPDNDGVNEQFATPGLQLGQWSCEIYNRWGVQVFYSPHYQQDWKAEGLSGGIYFYLLKNTDGQALKGWIEVMR